MELPAETLAAVEARAAPVAPDGALYAVRSSAVDEDGTGDSFAGQFESYLRRTRAADVPARIADVWRSGFGERVASYRAERGLADRRHDPDGCRAAHGRSPTPRASRSAPIRSRASVESPWSARSAGWARRSSPARRMPTPSVWTRAGGSSARTLAGDVPVLTDGEAIAVAALARAAEATYGVPQDVEWAYERRPAARPPVAADHHAADASARLSGELNIWDNSNIAESYGGVTTPLTFSFARRAYEAVYQEFCRILGVPDKTIEANSLVFARMLGLIRGRVYYNLLSWYRVLAMLPGYRFNRRFMEQMMGVRESLPDELVAEQGRVTRGARLADGARLVRTMAGLRGEPVHPAAPHRALLREARRDAGAAAARHDDAPTNSRRTTTTSRTGCCARWDAPLVNDFFAMLYFGLLRSLCERWVGDGDGTLQNDLLCAEGGMISTEPGARMRAMAECRGETTASSRTHSCMRAAPTSTRRSPRDPAFAEALTDYLARFGDRCLEELKLESATLDDDPLPLLRSVGRPRGAAPRRRDARRRPTTRRCATPPSSGWGERCRAGPCAG